MSRQLYRRGPAEPSRRAALRKGAIGGAGLVAAFALACGESRKEEPSREQSSGTSASPAKESTVAMAFFEDLHTLDPTKFYFGIDGGGIHQAITEQLVEYQWVSEWKPETGGWKFLAAGAKAWEQPDGTTYVFKLPAGAKFHDGTDVTSEAVKFAADRCVAMKSAFSYMFDDVRQIELVDQLTVKFSLNKPAEPFMHYMASFWTPLKLQSPTAVKQHDTSDDPNAEKWGVSNLVGQGPYKLEKHTPNQEYVAVLNPDYWNKKPGAHVTKYIGRIVPETTQQRLLLEGGDLQALRYNTPPADIEALKSKGFGIVRYPPYDGHVMWFNNSKGPFKDQRAREAIARSLDYDAIEKVILRGYGVRSQSILPRIFEGHKQGHQPTQQDLTKAKQLFSAAGVEGATVEFRYGPAAASFARPVSEQLQADLAKLNVKFDIQQLPGAVLTGLRKKPESTPDLVFGGNPADALSTYTLAYIFIHSKGPVAWHHATHPDVDALIDKAYSELDTQKRVGLYEEMSRLIGERVTLLQMYEIDHAVIHNPKLTGVTIHPGYQRSFNWYGASWSG